LLDHARRSAARRRSPGTRRVRVEDADAPGCELSFDPLVFDEALSRLERRDPLKAQIVQLRFFAGLTMPAVADALNVAERTIAEEWAFARAWLRRELGDDAAGN